MAAVVEVMSNGLENYPKNLVVVVVAVELFHAHMCPGCTSKMDSVFQIYIIITTDITDIYIIIRFKFDERVLMCQLLSDTACFFFSSFFLNSRLALKDVEF